MKKAIEIRQNILFVRLGSEFAVMTRVRDSEGHLKIIFSIPLRMEYADYISESGVALVDEISCDEGFMKLAPSTLFETIEMVELVTDILEKHENTL